MGIRSGRVRGAQGAERQPPDGWVSLTAPSIRREAEDPVGGGGVGDGPAGLSGRRPDDPAGQGDRQRGQGLRIEPCGTRTPSCRGPIREGSPRRVGGRLAVHTPRQGGGQGVGDQLVEPVALVGGQGGGAGQGPGGAGAELLDVTPPDARFRVADDAGATRLLSLLLGAGLPVVEVVAEEGRLERLFTGPATGGPS